MIGPKVPIIIRGEKMDERMEIILETYLDHEDYNYS